MSVLRPCNGVRRNGAVIEFWHKRCAELYVWAMDGDLCGAMAECDRLLSIPARGSLHEGLEVYVLFIATAAGNTTQQAAIFPFPFSGCQAVSARERFWPIILFLSATLNI